MKILFTSDYCEGAAPEIIERLTATNMDQTIGYGEDEVCAEARELIKKECGRKDVDVHFLVGGTQTNATVITSILKPYQGVLCAASGHINQHETGAIEHGGHKVLALQPKNGKISAEQIEEYAANHFFNNPDQVHIVQPGMVYISFPTELGTIYSLAELKAIKKVCQKFDMPLFVDGARLGYGLMSDKCDVTLKDLAKIADVFYIGGTKQGALFGEAVVITNDKLKKDFRYCIKQGGGMLAKGRLLGLQFGVLFKDGLYWKLAKHADEQGARIKKAFKAKGYKFLIDSPTNQQFPILTAEQRKAFARKFVFEIWQPLEDGKAGVRFCTSWATKPENVDKLIDFINAN